MAFVVYNGSPSFACSATVISPNVVLTAAHCLVDRTTGAPYPPDGYQVKTGALDWTNPADGQVSGVSRTIVYPGFSGTTMDGDAGLLVLSTPSSAPAVRLATAADSALSQAGTGAAIAGWGETQYGAGQLPGALQWANTVVQASAYCQAQAASFDSAKLCAADAPTFSAGACFGDSGGPLVAYQNSQPVEIGITSAGAADCATTAPNVFTRTDLISSWAAGWIAAVAPVSAPPAPQTGSGSAPSPTPQLPKLNPAVAAAYARQTLTGVFGRKFSRARRYHALCSAVDRTRVRCSVRWAYGLDAYSGTVTVASRLAGVGSAWSAAYRVTISSAACRSAGSARRSCQTSVAHGTRS